MTDISNLLIALGLIVVFLFFVKDAVKKAAKEELSNLTLIIETIIKRIDSIDNHINANAKNTVIFIDQKFEEFKKDLENEK